jgi:hypothetical protein
MGDEQNQRKNHPPHHGRKRDEQMGRPIDHDLPDYMQRFRRKEPAMYPGEGGETMSGAKWTTAAEKQKLELLGKQFAKLEEEIESLVIKARKIIGFENPESIDSEEWESIRFESMPEDAFVDYAVSSRKRWKIESLKAELKSIEEKL